MPTVSVPELTVSSWSGVQSLSETEPAVVEDESSLESSLLPQATRKAAPAMAQQNNRTRILDKARPLARGRDAG